MTIPTMRTLIELALYLLAARYVAYSLALSTYMAPVLGKRDPFRGETSVARRFVTAVLGLIWPVTVTYIVIAARVTTTEALPDSRRASRVLRRTAQRSRER